MTAEIAKNGAKHYFFGNPEEVIQDLPPEKFEKIEGNDLNVIIEELRKHISKKND